MFYKIMKTRVAEVFLDIYSVCACMGMCINYQSFYDANEIKSNSVAL